MTTWGTTRLRSWWPAFLRSLAPYSCSSSTESTATKSQTPPASKGATRRLEMRRRRQNQRSPPTTTAASSNENLSLKPDVVSLVSKLSRSFSMTTLTKALWEKMPGGEKSSLKTDLIKPKGGSTCPTFSPRLFYLLKLNLAN